MMEGLLISLQLILTTKVWFPDTRSIEDWQYGAPWGSGSLNATRGSHLPMEEGTPIPAHGGYWDREMTSPSQMFPPVASQSMLEMVPVTTQVHLATVPGGGAWRERHRRRKTGVA